MNLAARAAVMIPNPGELKIGWPAALVVAVRETLGPLRFVWFQDVERLGANSQPDTLANRELSADRQIEIQFARRTDRVPSQRSNTCRQDQRSITSASRK
jgi:hypothetical protein